jgi:hypothetical protein
MIVTASFSPGITWGCSHTQHWYRELSQGQICICGKEKLKQRKDYQPIQFNKIKTRKRKV